jgi:hypothetical protein
MSARDTSDCAGKRFDNDLHVKAARVDEALPVDENADMVAPKHKIAAGKIAGDTSSHGFAKHLLLEIGIAWRRAATGRQRELHQGRAIEAETGAPTP